MKPLLLSLCLALAGTSLTLAPLDVEAKRLGGGKPAGMQRQAPAEPARPAAPTQAQQAAPAKPAAVPPQAPKRSWLGPLAGLAAGLGIAALMSHLGMGAAFGEFLTMALLALVAFFAIRWIMGRMRGSSQSQGATSAGPQWAAAGMPRGMTVEPQTTTAPRAAAQADVALPPLQPVMRTADALGSASQFGTDALMYQRPAMALPEGFDVPAFERLAKMVFIRLQAANDTGAVEDLRKFTTPELFASLRLDLQERKGAAQHTDVVELDAKLVDAAKEDGQWIASVRFRGLIREEAGAEAAPFDELWHLVKPVEGEREWAIAGITPQD